MKLRTFILFFSFIFSGFIVPIWDALSQGTPSPISTLEPSKIDPLIRVRQMVENDPRNASDLVTKAIQADPQHSIAAYVRGLYHVASQLIRTYIRDLQ